MSYLTLKYVVLVGLLFLGDVMLFMISGEYYFSKLIAGEQFLQLLLSPPNILFVKLLMIDNRST